LRTILRVVLGFAAWFVLALLFLALMERLVGPIAESPVVAIVFLLFLSSGIFVVPLFAFFRWYTAIESVIVLDSEKGLTLTRSSKLRRNDSRQYDWKDVTGTEMIATMTAQGAVSNYTYHVLIFDGERLEVPKSIESFYYFLDIMNRSTKHLPYTWKHLDQGWVRSSREESELAS
jgi:hypothetical protein